MNDGQDKRRIQRIQLDSPIGAKVQTTTVTVVDISVTGARLEHDFPLTRGKHLSLEFHCNGQKVLLQCEVIRCKFEKHDSRAVYTSGVTFAEPGGESVATLRQMIIDYIERDLEARKAHLIRIR